MDDASEHRPTRRRRRFSRWRIICVRLAVVAASIISSEIHARDALQPSAAFVQYGSARETHATTVGLTWDWTLRRTFGLVSVTGYWDASISQWSYPEGNENRTATLGQVGLVPVFRLRPTGASSAWFAEGGIGATLMTGRYETGDKRFSTRFNFGDHIALGRNFGNRWQHELAVRLEHFSNAGIEHPNPGEGFVQLRYLYRFE